LEPHPKKKNLRKGGTHPPGAPPPILWERKNNPRPHRGTGFFFGGGRSPVWRSTPRPHPGPPRPTRFCGGWRGGGGLVLAGGLEFPPRGPPNRTLKKKVAVAGCCSPQCLLMLGHPPRPWGGPKNKNGTPKATEKHQKGSCGGHSRFGQRRPLILCAPGEGNKKIRVWAGSAGFAGIKAVFGGATRGRVEPSTCAFASTEGCFSAGPFEGTGGIPPSPVGRIPPGGGPPIGGHSRKGFLWISGGGNRMATTRGGPRCQNSVAFFAVLWFPLDGGGPKASIFFVGGRGSPSRKFPGGVPRSPGGPPAPPGGPKGFLRDGGDPPPSLFRRGFAGAANPNPHPGLPFGARGAGWEKPPPPNVQSGFFFSASPPGGHTDGFSAPKKKNPFFYGRVGGEQNATQRGAPHPYFDTGQKKGPRGPGCFPRRGLPPNLKGGGPGGNFLIDWDAHRGAHTPPPPLDPRKNQKTKTPPSPRTNFRWLGAKKTGPFCKVRALGFSGQGFLGLGRGGGGHPGGENFFMGLGGLGPKPNRPRGRG